MGVHKKSAFSCPYNYVTALCLRCGIISYRILHTQYTKELMDGIEDNSDGEVIAVECPKCGASYCAAKEYASKCPYCGEENGKKGEA